MKKRTITIAVLILSILLVVTYTIATTYAVIIDVVEKDGATEIVNEITIRDILTNEDGTYNNTYYDVKNELNVTDEEANLLMDSANLNLSLQTVLNSIVDYKLHGKAKMTNAEIYNLIEESMSKDDTISLELQNRVLTKTATYIQDVSDYLYDIDVNLLGES